MCTNMKIIYIEDHVRDQIYLKRKIYIYLKRSNSEFEEKNQFLHKKQLLISSHFIHLPIIQVTMQVTQ